MLIECAMAWCLKVQVAQFQAAMDGVAEVIAEPVEETVWDRLAECESHGEWDYGPSSGWGSHLYHGGLQFDPRTWEAYAPSTYPDVAYAASREQQIAVAERVLEEQGWKAWPVCSRKLGLR